MFFVYLYYQPKSVFTFEKVIGSGIRRIRGGVCLMPNMREVIYDSIALEYIVYSSFSFSVYIYQFHVEKSNLSRTKMPNQYSDIRTVDSTNFSYIFEQNVSVPLKSGGIVRCNVYKPKTASAKDKFPILLTYGPYGKDVPYKE